MELNVISFNTRRNPLVEEQLMRDIDASTYDFCLIQEMSGVVAARLPELDDSGVLVNHRNEYPNIGFNRKDELAVFFNRRFLLVVAIPIPFKGIQAIVVQSYDRRRIGIVNCHLPTSDHTEDYFILNVYPSLIYALLSVSEGCNFTWGDPVGSCSILIFGGDINQPHPDVVDLHDVHAVRNYLGEPFNNRSYMFRFITRLFGLHNSIQPSLNNWTFGIFLFDRNDYYARDANGRWIINVKFFDEQFKLFVTWLRTTRPGFNMATTNPDHDIITHLVTHHGWKRAVSLPTLRFLYQHFCARQTIAGLDLNSYHFAKNPGWTDVLFFSNNMQTVFNHIDFQPYDRIPRTGDHNYFRTEAIEIVGFGISYAADETSRNFRRHLLNYLGHSVNAQLGNIVHLLAEPAPLIRSGQNA